ncbi:serine hydrolase [Geothrix sp. PMB-07]|uniref:serine hydrolase n=1 Tax=Geothrix sp. PMB-07 TaxID=3068640 RepID=UPI0027409FDF|nr:serine hydrolase [Geothrix sp. PMB-07]WLT33514.1 peptidase S11 [Geothrix sp. PMB-07]
MGFGKGVRWAGSLLATGCLCLSAGAPHAPAQLALKSASALVLDQNTGKPLVEKQAGAVVPIASLTKLMTAMVLLDAHLDPKEKLTITKDDLDVLRHSRSRLPVGTQLPREQALLLALLASENRAAHALGRTFPGGLPAFVHAMNAKAAQLGLTGTRFEDPTGLSSGNVATAWDLARILQTAYTYPEIRDFTTRPEANLQAGRRSIAFPNTNALVRNSRWNIGLSKTGYIEEAGRCLVMQAMLANRPVLVILLDSWGKYSRLGDANRIKQWLEARRGSKG